MVAELAAALLSMIVSRRPTSLMAMDPKFLIPALVAYFLDLGETIRDVHCLDEAEIGAVAFLNGLPIVYHLWNWIPLWKLFQIYLYMLLTQISLTTMHLVDLAVRHECNAGVQLAGALTDKRVHRQVFIKNSHNQRILNERPLSFAVAAGLELVAWACITGKPHNAQWLWPLSPMAQARFEELFSLFPEWSHLRPVLRRLLAGQVPVVPSVTDSLWWGAIRTACYECRLASCHAKTTRDGGELLRCGGWCQGIAYYCCREHQNEAWPLHKTCSLPVHANQRCRRPGHWRWAL